MIKRNEFWLINNNNGKTYLVQNGMKKKVFIIQDNRIRGQNIPWKLYC